MLSILAKPYHRRMDTGRSEPETTVLVVEPATSSRLADAASRVDAADAIEVSRVDAALEAMDGAVDCVCTVEALPDGEGLDLVEAIADTDPGPPVVLAPEAGDESLASDAIAGGVAEYVPADRPPADLAAAIERAIEAGRRRRDRTERARQFSAVFDDPEAYAWVLAPDGTVRRANDLALAAIGAANGAAEGAEAVRGRPFESLPCWEAAPGGTDDVRSAVETAAGGEIAHREVAVDPVDGDDGAEPRTFELTIRPARDDSGAVVSLLARAADVTERIRLERELRESEQLHRVTLNNMTDTVLITDDEGAFTYVCPNVHFIFGYSDEEIHEMGTIDELLEPDLFDREELVREGVLTNLECTATDKAGREHTLLVNVREVSIQGGTTLYSCRDVTKRKRREEALTALHRTARKLLYAETDREIATIVVEDATDVLDCPASAAYLFDTDENVLRPAASSRGMTDLNGPLSSHGVGDGTIPGSVFVDGESRFLPDVHDSPALSDPATDLRSAAFVPLGDHGVFVAGSGEIDAFDEVSKELTDLLAATAEAALDRVERERRLRERDRELKRRNRQLTRLNQVNEIIREIDGALVGAETREEIETAVCERLTAADRFAFAWIGAPDAGDGRLEVRAHGGADDGRDYLDAVSLSLDDETREPAVQTARDGEVTAVSNVAQALREHPWRAEALTHEYQSVVSVPLSYDEFTYGVVTVYADRPDAFDEVTRAVLSELGETAASAIAAVERKRALLSDASTRLEFDVGDDGFVFTRLARRAGCTISFDGGVRQHEDGAAVFATVEGAPSSAVVSAAADLVAVDDARVVGEPRATRSDGSGERSDGPGGRSDGSGGRTAGSNGSGGRSAEEDGPDAPENPDDAAGTVLLQFSRPFLALRLADHGVVLRRVEASPDGARVVIDVPRSADASGSANVVFDAFSDVDLRSKRRVERTTPRDLRTALLDRLTDRQLEVVQLAYYGGYFETPRDRSGEEIADALGISPAAFYRHNRTVQRKLFTILFDELGAPANLAEAVE